MQPDQLHLPARALKFISLWTLQGIRTIFQPLQRIFIGRCAHTPSTCRQSRDRWSFGGFAYFLFLVPLRAHT